jgi:peptidoglycan/LPS O-acetylase OafA/YrhL
MHWGAVYGLAALFVAVFSRTGPRRSVRPFSLLLLLYWAIFNFVDHNIDITDSVEVSALMDAIGMSLAINACFQHFRWWTAALTVCFGCELLTHIAIMFMPESRASLYQYKLILNLLFAGELVSVATPTAAFHLRHVRTRLAQRQKQRQRQRTVVV